MGLSAWPGLRPPQRGPRQAPGVLALSSFSSAHILLSRHRFDFACLADFAWRLEALNSPGNRAATCQHKPDSLLRCGSVCHGPGSLESAKYLGYRSSPAHSPKNSVKAGLRWLRLPPARLKEALPSPALKEASATLRLAQLVSHVFLSKKGVKGSIPIPPLLSCIGKHVLKSPPPSIRAWAAHCTPPRTPSTAGMRTKR